MLQKTLITVGASLTAVVLLLFMMQRKKLRPAPVMSSESEKDAGQAANNNEDAGTSKDDLNTAIKSDISGKTPVAPNGVVVKTVSNSKVEEGSTEQASKKVSVETFIEPLVQELCNASSVELAYQKTSCDETSLQQSLVQHELTKTLFSEPSCTVLNIHASQQAMDLSVIEQITATVNNQGNELPAAQDVVAASEPVNECPLQQQKQASGDLELQQSPHLTTQVDCWDLPNSSLISGETVPMSIEESSPEDKNLLSETKSDQHINSQSTDISESPGGEQKYADTEQVENETDKQELKKQITSIVNKQRNKLPAAQDVAASEPIDECPLQQQNQASEDSALQQSPHLDTDVDGCDLSNSSLISGEPDPMSIEESTPEDNKLLSQTKSDQHINRQSSDITESSADEQKYVDTEERDDNDTDKQELKVEATEVTHSKNSIKNSKSSCEEPVTMACEQSSDTDTLGLTNSHSLLSQTNSEQSNGGHVLEPSQTESMQSNEESIQEISQNSEAEPSNGEPLQESSQLESEQSNGKMVENASCSGSGQSFVEAVKKKSHSEARQANGASINKSTDTVEQLNGGSIQPASDVEHYYDNHKVILPEKSNNTYRQGDYRKLWPQPDDGLIFVKSSAGQPLVPQHLRDTDYLSNRTIPIHDPATTAFLYSNMNKLVYPPENWVRVISVSENLELRVRHDERDMLLEQLERKGLCEPSSKSPPPRLLTVGNLVAAHLDVPQRGLIWCRAHITAVLPVTGNQNYEGPSGRRKGRQPQPQHQPQPLFMVESIDHFPAASSEPMRASDLRPLAAHALQAPFYDQLFYLLNTMPADAVEYSSTARDMLLEQLRTGHNFLRVTGPVSSTFISGTCYWMASLSAVHTRDTDGAVCLLEEELQKSEHAIPIYSGRVLDGLPFDKCIFRDGEAFWSDDDRCPSSLNPSCGPPNPLQEYLWLRRTDPRIIQAFRGFKLPYKHAKHQFKCMGFNMSLHEYYTVYRHHSSTVLLTADPDKVLKVVLDDPQALVILDFHMQTLIRFYHFDPKMIADPESHVAKDNTPMHMLSFLKDDNGFLILGNDFFSDFTKENLRIPIMPF